MRHGSEAPRGSPTEPRASEAGENRSGARLSESAETISAPRGPTFDRGGRGIHFGCLREIADSAHFLFFHCFSASGPSGTPALVTRRRAAGSRLRVGGRGRRAESSPGSGRSLTLTVPRGTESGCRDLVTSMSRTRRKRPRPTKPRKDRSPPGISRMEPRMPVFRAPMGRLAVSNVQWEWSSEEQTHVETISNLHDPEIGHHFQASAAGHLDVQQDQVRTQLHDPLDGSARRSGALQRGYAQSHWRPACVRICT